MPERWIPDELSHAGRWLFEPMLEAAGFEIADAEYEAAVYGAYTCLKK